MKVPFAGDPRARVILKPPLVFFLIGVQIRYIFGQDPDIILDLPNYYLKRSTEFYINVDFSSRKVQVL
jgi:hypothetical protein